MSEWRKKTCESCEFRVGTACRRLPPISNKEDIFRFNYPEVFDCKTKEFENACAEYQKKEGEC